MQTSIDPHGLALVPSQLFMDRMVQHWSQISNGAMFVTSALREAWGLFAAHSRCLIINNASDSAPLKPSIVLPLPTGSGKTEGTCVYAALQAESNAKDEGTPIGVLIVTRLIADADKVAAKINELAGRDAATASHTDNKLNASEMAEFDVLVITHAAFMHAARSYAVGDGRRWDTFHSWRGGKRHLVIVDEALLNAVDHHKVTSKDIGLTLRALPHEIRDRFAGAVKTLTSLQAYLDRKQQKQAPGENPSETLWGEGSPRHAEEIMELQKAMRGVEFSRDLYTEDASRHVSTILEDVQIMLEGFAYYHRNGAQHSLNSSRYLVPREMPGVLLLDATARCNVIYDLLAGGVVVAEAPEGVRDYSNVTLNVARTASGLGKTKMEETKQTRVPRLLDNLAEVLGPDRKVFLCVHKCVKDLAATYSAERLPFRVGYWGAVDGSNAWADCDVAVIFGLYWQDPTRPINNVFAIDGPKETSWLRAPSYGDHPDILALISQKDVSASVIQAINRVRCRKVIDTQGRCEPADIFIVLPKDWRGDAILEDIRANMPNIRETPWAFEPDGPKVYAPRSKSAAEAVIGLMRSRESGATPLPYVQRQLSLTKRQLARLKEDLAKPASKLTTALHGLGVFYRVEGKGRGAKSFLVKSA